MTDPNPQTGSPEAIEADIARQREDLAETVNALQAKLDVKTRASDKATELKDRATTESGKPRPELAGAVIGFVVVVVAVAVWRRRR